MKVTSVSAYDDYSDGMLEEKGGEGVFSPFTFLCFALILFLFGLIVLFSSSMDEAILAGRPFWHYLVTQGSGALAAIILGVLFRFLPDRISLNLHFVLLPLSWVAMGLSLLLPSFSEYSKSAGVLSIFSTVYYLSWCFTFVQKRERKGFALLALIPITIFSLVFTALCCGLGWFFLGLVLILVTASSFSSGKGYILFFLIAGIIIFLFLSAFSPSVFSAISYSSFPVADSSFYSTDLLVSRMAVRDGGIAGTGLGKGLYKLGILSDPKGELVFATLYEETGLVGVVIIVLSLIVVMVVGVRTENRALRSGDTRSASLAIGLSVSIILPFFFNILHTLGLNPFGGVGLPFFSYSPLSEAIYVFSSITLYRLVYRMGRKSDEEK